MAQPPRGIEIQTLRSTGSARVSYSARQILLKRPVLLVGVASGVLASSPLSRQLEAEAKVLAELDHPHILRLYDYIQEGDQSWLVLEDVDGPSLSQLIAKRMSWQAVAALGLDLSRALSHAHGLGHYHRSLTPSQIQFTKTGSTKLSGFGRNMNPESEQVELLDTESRGGLSPETSIGQAQSPLSDIFALGSLLYEAASQKSPFGEIRAIDYPSKVRNAPHEPLVRCSPQLPHALSALIEQMLEKLPPLRPASAAVLSEQFEALIGSDPLPVLRQELGRLGFSSPPGGPLPNASLRPAEKKSQLLPSRALVMGVGLGLLVLGTSWLALRLGRPVDTHEVARSLNPHLDTERKNALHLRVVASPWAHVLVDGVHRETTPFAQPLALTPGTHRIRLEHPNASAEERTISGQAGQVVLLNVQMHVRQELPSSIFSAEVKESSP